MLRKFLVPLAAGGVVIAGFMPAAASAQSFGIYVGTGNPGYYDPHYAYPRYYDPDARRDAWIAHERWEQRERWEREQRARRAYWRHERWEENQMRRAWHQRQWQDRREWDDDDDD